MSIYDVAFYVLTAIEYLLIVFLIGLVLLVVGLMGIYIREEYQSFSTRRRKAKHRKKKEEEAWAGYFFINFSHGFDSTGAVINRFGPVPTEEGVRLMKELDELADSELFEKTEEIHDDLR